MLNGYIHVAEKLTHTGGLQAQVNDADGAIDNAMKAVTPDSVGIGLSGGVGLNVGVNASWDVPPVDEKESARVSVGIGVSSDNLDTRILDAYTVKLTGVSDGARGWVPLAANFSTRGRFRSVAHGETSQSASQWAYLIRVKGSGSAGTFGKARIGAAENQNAILFNYYIDTRPEFSRNSAVGPEPGF